MTLEEIRARIDAVDRDILAKLNHRIYLSLETGKFKTETKDVDRETQLLNQIKQETEKYMYLRGKFTAKIFKTVMQESRRLQKSTSKEES